MYKNCYAVKKPDVWNVYDIHLWTDEGYTVEEFQNYGYQECGEYHATHWGLNDEPLKKVYNWNRSTEGLHYADHTQGNIHTKFLIDKYGTNDETSKTHREVFFDIEIEMGGALTPEYIASAPKPITSIAWWDKQKDKWAIVILDKTGEIKAGIQDGREIIPVSRENDLIEIFLTRMEAIKPDILVGYNSDYFDIPYIYYRIKNRLGERTAKRLSPIRIVEERDKRWYPDQPIRIAGVTSLDYMRLHKKYSFQQEPSMKLDSLGEKYVNQGKIEYDGSLDRLFAEDKQKFIDYNFVDVLILKKLDEKFKYLDLTKNISHKGKCVYEEVYQSSRTQDGAISAYLLGEEIIPPNKDTNPIIKEDIDGNKLSYAGGYLFCPKTGIYNYMFDEDLTSLYPSIIMSLNIGRETLIGRLVTTNDRDNRLALNDLKKMDPKDEFEVENLKRKKITMSVGEILALISQNDLAITANGVMFRTDKPSTLSVVLSKWFDERVEYKKAMKKAFKAGNKEEGELNHLRQYTMKILLNSLYGATALPTFRYGSVLLSEGITLTGQRIIQDSGTFINKTAEETLETGKEVYEIRTTPRQRYEDCSSVVVYEDTDSCYVNAEPLLRKLYPNFDEMEETEKSDKLEAMSLDYEKKINEYYNDLALDAFNVPVDKHRLEMKTECTIRSAFFSGKRRYAQYITKKEGVACNEIDVKGLDFKKSNFPPLFRTFFESILHKILFGETRANIDKEILAFKESLKDMDFVKISKPTGVKGIIKHQGEPAQAGQIFSTFKEVLNKSDKKLGAPVGVKAAIRYNDLLKFKNLDKIHTQIVEGDKIKWVYLRDNPYKIDTIGFLDFDLPGPIRKFIERYVDIPKSFDTILKNKLESFYQDLGWGNLTLNTYVHQFFKF
jgi:DNA polymerase elongation subunit (family B)